MSRTPKDPLNNHFCLYCGSKNIYFYKHYIFCDDCSVFIPIERLINFPEKNIIKKQIENGEKIVDHNQCLLCGEKKLKISSPDELRYYLSCTHCGFKLGPKRTPEDIQKVYENYVSVHKKRNFLKTKPQNKTENIIKKKRGRKPKTDSTTKDKTENIIKKKRGRKPKTTH